MIPPSRNLDGNRPVDLLYESLVEALKATAGGSAALNRPLSQSPTATPSSRAPTVKNLSFQESSAPVHAARRRGCTELLTLGCQKFCAPSGIFQRSSAPNSSYYSGFSQRYLSEHRTGTTEAGPAGSRLRSSPLASQIRSITETGVPFFGWRQECCESQR
jgi:hypothetical protein